MGQPESALGASISVAGGKPTVTGVARDGSAWQGGLNVGDEVVALDGMRATDDLSRGLAGRPVGSTVRLLVARDGMLRELTFPLQASPVVRYRMEPVENATPAQLAVRRKWLQLKS